MEYRHKQVGYLMITLLIIPLLSLLFVAIFFEFSLSLLIGLFVLLVALVLFPSLEVEVGKMELILKFGFGIISKKFNLENIKFCRIVRNPWYYGWGIRLTPYGWLYNVSGLSAIEIETKNGKKYRIGTNEPQKLKYAIIKKIK